MTETPVSRPADDTGADPAAPAPSQAAGAPPAQALEASGSLPITPPLSPRLESESKASLDTAHSRRSTQSHQEYLDKLQPPSDQDFHRLARVQEEREQEHKRRNRHLLDQSAHLGQQSSVAQQEFVEAKHHHGLHSLLGHARRDSQGRAMAAEQAGSDSDNVQHKAATLIQRNYRGYRVRREMKGLGLDANTRWTHAIRDAQWRRLNTPRSRGNSMLSPDSAAIQAETPNDASRPRSSQSAARQNWRKVAAIARRAGGDQDSSHSDDDSDSLSDVEANPRMNAEQRAALRERRASLKAKRRKRAKMMGLQYFLEMVDLKHRYGSNLRQYHEEWKRADTNENYFYWLDYGEGRNIELASCPRDRLDRERVRYLSREERQHYLVKVDAEGRLCWAKNGVRIDTTEQWKDSINGIVPIDDETPAFAPEIEAHSQEQQDAPRPHYQRPDHDDSSSDVSSNASESELEAARAAKYATPTLDDAKGLKKVKHVSAATIFNKLLRKSVKKNTWIFVADTSFRLYVGIKASGSFQHSSFLQGSRISAAGLIKIKNGRLSSLSPLSGHYRPPASNFRAFVHSLKDEGVDMSHVSISKSYAVLVGLEAYVKTRKKGKETLQKVTHHKQKLLDPEQALKQEEASKDTSQSAELERRHLEKQETAREKRPAIRFLQKLGLRPRAPSVQKHASRG
ncbi:putative IQ domain-containing protein IQM6 [Seiridium unicorne]|uniref:IQ domain-containing protein IQM6 n=1 Tax=Seiridium unicorne TaxID=138068 RepID=A0ABR2VGE0_9PEZI